MRRRRCSWESRAGQPACLVDFEPERFHDRRPYQGKPRSEQLTILSDRRRPLPRYATAFREMLAEHCRIVFRYRSPRHWLDTFRTYYGPMNKASAALDADKQALLAEELELLTAKLSREQDSLVPPSEYLEVIVTVR